LAEKGKKGIFSQKIRTWTLMLLKVGFIPGFRGLLTDCSPFFILEKKFQKAYNTKQEEIMKLKKFRKKLNLNKKTIVNLNNKEMKNVFGNGIIPMTTTCTWGRVSCANTQCYSILPYHCH
jgi:hypothetical protein